MARLRLRIRTVCGNHFHTCQMWHQKTDSTVATAIRTIIVLLFSWAMVFIVGSAGTVTAISQKTWLFLILSGFATGASWLCYFRALAIGDVNKVVPIDKSSTVLTIILALLFLHEGITVIKAFAILAIAVGTFLMIQKKEGETGNVKGSSWFGNLWFGNLWFGNLWFLYACGSAVFASLQAILGKIGIDGVESNLGTAIRTCIVLLMAWIMVFVSGKQKTVKDVSKNELGFICLSGLATGASWLCYYKALQLGPASVVVPIDKLSILVTIAFSYIVFKEKLNRKSALGLALIVIGTLAMLKKS